MKDKIGKLTSNHEARAFDIHYTRYTREVMSYNVSGWGTVGANQTISIGYILNNGQDLGAQYAQGKPEGASLDGSSNGALVSFNHEIDLDIASQKITYSFQLQNLTGLDTSFALCGGGLT